jgi:hypothetical protein
MNDALSGTGANHPTIEQVSVWAAQMMEQGWTVEQIQEVAVLLDGLRSNELRSDA